MFSNALAQAADNFGTGDHLARNGAEHNGAARSKGETDLHTAAPDGGPLAGVVIFVSKKLARKQGGCKCGVEGAVGDTQRYVGSKYYCSSCVLSCCDGSVIPTLSPVTP